MIDISNVNDSITASNKKSWERRSYIPEPPEYQYLFKINGEGLYIVGVTADKKSCISNLISYISGKISHAFVVFYSENMREHFTDDEWVRLVKAYFTFYSFNTVEEAEVALRTTKVLVLASADQIGSAYYNYSFYRKRKQVIIKPTLTPDQTEALLGEYVSEKMFNKSYDFTGLVFWLMKKYDDERAYFCSEQVYDIFKRSGYQIGNRDNPSPTQLIRAFRNMDQGLYKIVFANTNLGKI